MASFESASFDDDDDAAAAATAPAPEPEPVRMDDGTLLVVGRCTDDDDDAIDDDDDHSLDCAICCFSVDDRSSLSLSLSQV